MSELADIQIIKKIIGKVNEKLSTSFLIFNNQYYNDAVSRMYYAVFHIISALLLIKGLTFSSHGQVIGNFNREFIKSKILPEDFSKKIEILFKYRQIGDYGTDEDIEKEKAEEIFHYAKEIVHKSKEYLSEMYQVDMSFWD